MKLFYRYCVNATSVGNRTIALLLLTQLFTLAHSQPIDPVKLKSLEKNYIEELYIRTDRDLYISGEKVWLKIYKLNRLTQSPSNLSKIVYVDLLDADNNPVSQLKIEIDGYSGSGDLNLPDTLRTGNYFLRSYTNWMQNFPEDLFAYKKISVINPYKIQGIKIPSTDQSADSVVFFTEGIIDGLESRLGFKSMNKAGDPVKMAGAVINDENDTLCHVQTDDNGNGWATIKPSGTGKLFLISLKNKGKPGKFQLPPVHNDGIILSTAAKGENPVVPVKLLMSKNFAPSGSNLYLVVNSVGLTSFRKEITIKKGGIVSFSQKEMPPGLLHLMIVDEHDNISADRWVYNETCQPVNFTIKTLKETFSQREKIKVTISASDSKGDPIESDFSVSVVKRVAINNLLCSANHLSQLPELISGNSYESESDINDYLLFYNSHNPILIANGKSVNMDPAYMPEIEGHLISGNIRYTKTGEPVKNQKITLSFVGKVALCQFARTNEKGEFHFKTSQRGLHEIVIQPLSEEIKDYYVELKNPFTPPTKKYNYGVFYPDTTRLHDINNMIIGTQINNLYKPYNQNSTIKKVTEKNHDFYGKPENTIPLANYIELTSIKEVIKEIIPGVTTVRKNDRINFRMNYPYQSKPYEHNPLVLVDGVPVYDLEKVLAINSRDLEKIDVFTTRYYISDIVLDGILHFVTKKGNLGVIDLDRSAYRVEYDLPENHNVFYSPDYLTDKQLHDRIPDFRNTLYWNPEMHTDKTGKASLEFYSSDESGEYIITVEGITTDGKTGVGSIPLKIGSR